MSTLLEPGKVVEGDDVFFLTLAKGDRTSIAYTVQRLIDMLDAMEPDPELEDGADAEPSLGALDNLNQEWWGHSERDEREDENEHGGDIQDEPHDPADCGDDEPNLGWRETCCQWKEMQVLGLIDMEQIDPNDTDCISIMGGVPLEFQGDGKPISKALVRDAGPRIEPCNQTIGERVTIMPDGKEFRTFVPASSGYMVRNYGPPADTPDMTFSAFMGPKKRGSAGKREEDETG